VDSGHFGFAWCGWLKAGTRRYQHVAWAGDSPELARLLGMEESRSEAETLVAAAMRTRVPEISENTREDARLAAYGPEILARGYQSIVALPLVAGIESVGCMVLATAERAFFDTKELRLLVELAGDISFALEHINQAERLHYLAYYDELTGMANRTLFHERLTMHLASTVRADRRLALIVTQIDRFESVVDTLGRNSADHILQEAATRFAACAGTLDVVARIGPEQFAAIMPGIADAAAIIQTLDAWWPAWLGTPFRAESDEFRLAGHAGVAIFPADGMDADTLLKHAEAALKNARATGDRQLFYTQHLSERGSAKLALESRLRRALANEEYRLFYQPKVELGTRRITGVEALIRWQDPEGRLVPPAEFIPLLEETGMIVEVGAWALRQACLDRSRWLDLGSKAPRVAVNVSTVQLRRADFVRMIKNTLRIVGSEPGIDIEVTESLIMQDVADTIAKLVAIRDFGVQIAIDDFGTGYSSLGYLARLPVAVLKIDRSFIISMLDDPSAMTLVSTIISLAHALRLEVVAEGVESEEQAKILRLVRCDQMQGYLVSRPIPFDEMTAFLGRHRA
jgi:diguanylate cyclase (GGDEF)-like protein